MQCVFQIFQQCQVFRIINAAVFGGGQADVYHHRAADALNHKFHIAAHFQAFIKKFDEVVVELIEGNQAGQANHNNAKARDDFVAMGLVEANQFAHGWHFGNAAGFTG